MDFWVVHTDKELYGTLNSKFYGRLNSNYLKGFLVF